MLLKNVACHLFELDVSNIMYPGSDLPDHGLNRSLQAMFMIVAYTSCYVSSSLVGITFKMSYWCFENVCLRIVEKHNYAIMPKCIIGNVYFHCSTKAHSVSVKRKEKQQIQVHEFWFSPSHWDWTSIALLWTDYP